MIRLHWVAERDFPAAVLQGVERLRQSRGGARLERLVTAPEGARRRPAITVGRRMPAGEWIVERRAGRVFGARPRPPAR